MLPDPQRRAAAAELAQGLTDLLSAYSGLIEGEAAAGHRRRWERHGVPAAASAAHAPHSPHAPHW